MYLVFSFNQLSIHLKRVTLDYRYVNSLTYSGGFHLYFHFLNLHTSFFLQTKQASGQHRLTCFFILFGIFSSQQCKTGSKYLNILDAILEDFLLTQLCLQPSIGDTLFAHLTSPCWKIQLVSSCTASYILRTRGAFFLYVFLLQQNVKDVC